MRHNSRVLSQTLKASQTLSQSKHLQTRQKFRSLSLSSILHPKSQHTRTSSTVLPNNMMPRVRSITRVVDLLNLRMLQKHLSASLSVAKMPLHADVQGLQASVAQVAVKGRGHGADRELGKVQFLVQLGRLGDDQAHDDVGVAVHVLGGAVEGHVGAEGDGPLEVGRHEGVVDDREAVVFAGNVGDGADVDDLHGGVGGGLDPDQFGVGSGGGVLV